MTVTDIHPLDQPVTAPGRRDRWQPTRAGLVGLWRYWDETFAFHRGRLLLRGPNGSGKSMALELLLPFVLDADSSPGRLTSAAKSRGGLYDRIMTGTDDSSRAGYAWVEFRRGDDVFTAGVRLRASASTRRVDTDFFTTTLAVGIDLNLLDEQREPLTRKVLAAAVATTGRVHTTREEHRAAVRAVLFPGFSADRYDSVITALLALRKEKLSQNLDLAKLSEVLTEALPAIDEHELASVAEGFERLDRRRAELTALEAEVGEVRRLASRQRAYARAVVAQVAGRVRAAESRRDTVTREEREATTALDTARHHAAAVNEALTSTGARIDALDDELDALRSSGAYKEGGQLADLEHQLARLRESATRAEIRRTNADRDASEDVAALANADEQLAIADSNLETALGELRAAGDTVGADAVLDEAITNTDDVDDALRLVHAWLTARRGLIAEVRAGLAEHHQAIARRVQAEEQVAADDAAVAARETALRSAIAAVEDARERFVAECETWVDTCRVTGADRVRDALRGVRRHPDDVRAAIDTLTAELRAEHAVGRAALAQRRADAAEQGEKLRAERADVATGGLVDPPAPYWRDERSGRAGAPLWQLVDARGDESLDGLEAALNAAGLLDAWVRPDGHVDLTTDAADITLTAEPCTGPTLLDYLVVLPDTAVPTDVVAAVLHSVPVRPTAAEGGAATPASGASAPEVVIGLDGTFHLGAATGRGPRIPASLLGAAARERHRLRRLEELDADIAAADRTLAAIEGEGDAFARLAAATVDELNAVPQGSAVLDAEGEHRDATVRLTEATDRRATSRATLRDAEEAVRSALRALTLIGARHHLPTSDAELAGLESALTSFGDRAQVWGRRHQDQLRRREQERHAADRAERATAAARDAAQAADDAHAEVRSLTTQVATIRSSIGVEYDHVLARVDKLSHEQRASKTRAKELGDERSVLDQQIGKLEGKVADATEQRARAETDRLATHRDLVRAVGAGLNDDAGTPAPLALDGVTAVLDAARTMLADVGEPDDNAVERTSSRVDEALHQARTALGRHVDLYRELADEGWWILRAATSGLRRRIEEIANALTAELQAGREELAADEEQLFEQVLAGSVRRALADRIRMANQLVERINQQLAKVRTRAGGVEVRLRWGVDPDQPDAVRAARSLLLRDPADLSDDETASLQAFVRARVEQARVELEASSPWEARLRTSLDYRAWHHFALHVGHRDWEGHRPATPRLLARLSTGERSIALHLPMLASIAAHYAGRDGEPSECPRLILLDELFAGVDAANRAQLFGTFTDWDLDAVFTSDHEWCQYATLDGIAIHHLHPPTADEPVTSTCFRWDGHERTIVVPPG